MNEEDFKKIILEELYFHADNFTNINNSDRYLSKTDVKKYIYKMIEIIDERINTYKLKKNNILNNEYISNELYKFADAIKNSSNLKVKRQTIPNSIRFEVFKKCNNKCVICGATKDDCRLEIDHIKPVSRGGLDELDNLQVLCKDCNISKSNRILDEVKA